MITYNLIIKQYKINLLTSLVSVLLLTFGFSGHVASQNTPLAGQDFSVSVRNLTPTSDRTLEFDIFLLDTDPAQTFELASVQCGITVNSAIFAGGTFSASLVAASSGLSTAQAPVQVTFTTGTGANLVKLAAVSPPGTGNGTIISAVSPGTRVARIKLTSTVAFPSNSYANPAFVSNTAGVPSYATRIAYYSAGINVQLAVTPGTNALVFGNPVLNSLYPVAFSMTGGGTCCENTGGMPVGLSGSQIGCTYTLFRNDVQVGSPVAGTGAAITFPGNQAAGTYSASSSNANGTAQMLGTSMVMFNPVPVPVVASNSPVCAGATLNLTANPAGMTTYAWAGQNGFNSSLQNPVISGVTATNAGTYYVTVTNSYGCSATTSTSVVVSALPGAPVISGPSSICTGASGINYSTEPSMTAYNWIVTGGAITSGTGTNTISVTWGAVGTGNVSVNYNNTGLCFAAAATNKAVTISPLPLTQRTLENMNILSGQSFCADAVQTIYVAGNGTTFNVEAGGTTHLIAGQNVIISPGTTVQNGGTLHAYISSDCLYCSAPKSVVANNAEDANSEQETISKDSRGDFFRVFPNPTSGRITIEILNTVTNHPAAIDLFGMQGSWIATLELNDQNRCYFDLGAYPSGIYVVRAVAGNEVKTAKILKY